MTLLGPLAHGGGGQDWTTALRVVRAVSAGDGSIGQLLGYHYLWFWARPPGRDPRADRRGRDRRRPRSAGSSAARSTHATATWSSRDEGDELVYTGTKSFSTGGRVADVTVLEGVIEGTEKHVFAIVPTDQPALRFLGDWDSLGQRLTESGGVVDRGRPGAVGGRGRLCRA